MSIWASLSTWRAVDGIVVHADPLYMAKAEGSAPLLKLLLLVLFLPFILSLIIAALFISVVLSVSNFGRGGGGLGSQLASQLLGYFLVGKLFGPPQMVPVRDFRVRDSGGAEHLVRLRGDFITGGMNVGDTVELKGYDRSGTLIFVIGNNTRLGTRIRVRRQ